MILVLDNYDSFTYNLVQYMGEVTGNERAIEVRRNDALTVEDIRRLRPRHLIISPGPCTPAEAGISIEAVQSLAGELPILGVCLGHQAIAEAFGAKVVRARRVVHGKTSRIHHSGQSIFAALDDGFQATRYHSLVVDPETLGEDLEVLAWSEETEDRPSEIMAIRHRRMRNVIGVQFHPESVLTTPGKQLLSNFLSL